MPFARALRRALERAIQPVLHLQGRQFCARGGVIRRNSGQKLCDLPEGWIRPLGGWIKLNSTSGTATAGTAGEIGLGSTIGSGANATLGAVGAAAEDMMEGTTISNHVAVTALQSNKANDSVRSGTQGATPVAIYDGTATAMPVHFNIASTWDSTGGVTVNSLTLGFDFQWIKDA